MYMVSLGKRFCMNPEKTEARWLDPAIKQHLYPDWQDVTDLGPDELLAHIQAPAEHQLDLFA